MNFTAMYKSNEAPQAEARGSTGNPNLNFLRLVLEHDSADPTGRNLNTTIITAINTISTATNERHRAMAHTAMGPSVL